MGFVDAWQKANIYQSWFRFIKAAAIEITCNVLYPNYRRHYNNNTKKKRKEGSIQRFPLPL